MTTTPAVGAQHLTIREGTSSPDIGRAGYQDNERALRPGGPATYLLRVRAHFAWSCHHHNFYMFAHIQTIHRALDLMPPTGPNTSAPTSSSSSLFLHNSKKKTGLRLTKSVGLKFLQLRSVGQVRVEPLLFALTDVPQAWV